MSRNHSIEPRLTSHRTAYTTTITATFTPVVYASVTATPRIIPGVPREYRKIDKFTAICFSLGGFGAAVLLWCLINLLCGAVRRCRVRRRERRAGRVEVGEGRDEPRCDVPNGSQCDVPKGPPGYVEEFEMA